MKKIFAVIVTYNAMQWIDKCLQCLRESTVPLVPVLIDNCSNDGTREYVPIHYPEVVWFPQAKNLGFGQGNNVGIRYALHENADYVLLLNQDAFLEKNALQNLLDADDGMSVLSPLHFSGNGVRLDISFKSYLYRADKIMLLDDLLVKSSMSEKYPVPSVPAACWFIPKIVLQKIGGFNPIFFHYCEDGNYAHRLEYHKVRFFIVPKASMCHDRAEHGNMVVFNRNRLRREMLCECCNINNGIVGISVRLFRLLALCYLSDLPRQQYRIGTFSLGLFWIIAHIREIFYSRKVDRQVGMNWL